MGRWGATVSLIAAIILAVGLAGPSSASDEITQNAVGTYAAQFKWGTYTWVAIPCDDNVNQCINVTEYAANDTSRTNPHWSANAYWSVGSWITWPVDVPDQLVCKADGSKHSLVFTFSWDAATNVGQRAYYNPGICDGKAHSDSAPFTLTKVGPAPSAAEH